MDKTTRTPSERTPANTPREQISKLAEQMTQGRLSGAEAIAQAKKIVREAGALHDEENQARFAGVLHTWELASQGGFTDRRGEVLAADEVLSALSGLVYTPDRPQPPPASAASREVDQSVSAQTFSVMDELYEALEDALESDKNFATSSLELDVQLDATIKPFYRRLVAVYDQVYGRTNKAQDEHNAQEARQDCKKVLREFFKRHSVEVRREKGVLTPEQREWRIIEDQIDSKQDEILAQLRNTMNADPATLAYDPEDREDLLLMGLKYALRDLKEEARARFDARQKEKS